MITPEETLVELLDMIEDLKKENKALRTMLRTVKQGDTVSLDQRLQALRVPMSVEDLRRFM